MIKKAMQPPVCAPKVEGFRINGVPIYLKRSFVFLYLFS
ncbi:unnamed protein product, partial [marine sediment metagenome]